VWDETVARIGVPVEVLARVPVWVGVAKVAVERVRRAIKREGIIKIRENVFGSPSLLSRRTTFVLVPQPNGPFYFRSAYLAACIHTKSLFLYAALTLSQNPNYFITLGLKKKFCKTLTTKLSVLAVECSRRIFENRDNAQWTPGFAASA
jgi:hypothetical protein